MMTDAYSGLPVNVNEKTRDYIDSIQIEERIIDSVLPDIHTEIFGEMFDTPVMTPAFSHMKPFADTRANPEIEYARAAKRLNAVNWIGMESDETVKQILLTGARTVRIIKPFLDREKILSQIRFAEENGAFAVGIDVDHVFGNDGQYDVVDGEQMGPVSMDDIREYAASTELPFIVKGVLSVQDAVKCAACGVSGIVVSHHSGRVPCAVPPLKVLPDIAEALAGTDVYIFADCHIDSGIDAFKALALGADAVCVGRAMLEPLKKEGEEGVFGKISKMNAELITVMGYTGAADPYDIDPSVLWIE